LALATPLAIGVVLALSVSLMARLVGFDRDRAFYPVVLIVVGSYYELFAVIGESTSALLLESFGFGFFLLLAIVGFRRNLWLVAAGLAAHGVYDFFHGRLIDNPGVPAWWPAFCGSYDVTAGALLAWLQRIRHGD
jgi:hypothetical protein